MVPVPLELFLRDAFGLYLPSSVCRRGHTFPFFFVHFNLFDSTRPSFRSLMHDGHSLYLSFGPILPFPKHSLRQTMRKKDIWRHADLHLARGLSLQSQACSSSSCYLSFAHIWF